MRLEQLEMKNFGSYREASIDLREVAAAVVTGTNGAGKSTGFVDAPLAALFGKCRVSLDDMMALGTDDMVLTVVFLLNGQRYRVIRKRSKKTRAGKSELALQIADGDGWTDASGSRIQDTQEKICQLLNADYELVTATGFLLQGQADRFSRATPTERKAILAQILRLDQYGPLKQAANRHLTIADTKHMEKQSQLAMLELEASTLAGAEARQLEVTVALDESRNAIAKLELHQQDLTTTRAGMAAELEQLQTIPQQLTDLQSRQSALLKDQAMKTSRRDRAAKILEKRATIEAKVIEEAVQQRGRAHLEEHLTDLQTQLDTAATELHQVTTELLNGTRLRTAMDLADRRLADLVGAYHRETICLGDEIAREEEQTKLLTQVPCDADLQKVCRFTVNAAKAKAALPDKQQRYANRWGAEDSIMEQVYPSELKVVKDAQEMLAAWSAKKWDDQKTVLDERRTGLLLSQRNVKQQLDATKLVLIELAKFTALVPELAAAEREVTSVDQDLAKVAEELSSVEQQLSCLQLRLDDRVRLTTEHSRLSAEWQQDQNYLVRLRADGQTAVGRLKELELEIKRAHDAGRQAEELRGECDRLRVDGSHFQTLITAYAQIPVLILESSIPLLEEEANKILGKISPSGMRVRLDTQKALKSRDGLAETLEIVVRDVYGERPYENYSGGEKFRLDLALRIGLSKLLANRAGAKLETLIIDEGLGSLDEDGLAQLRECLATLQAEFPLVLVITHVEAMKHTFPSQLVVSKNGSGSRVDVVA